MLYTHVYICQNWSNFRICALKSKEVMPRKSNWVAKYYKARNQVESLSLQNLPDPSKECEADREDISVCSLECLLSRRGEIIETIADRRWILERCVGRQMREARRLWVEATTETSDCTMGNWSWICPHPSSSHINTKHLAKPSYSTCFGCPPPSLSPGIGGGLWQSTECDLEVYAQQSQRQS